MHSPEVGPLRWGWIAVLYFEGGGGWLRPTEAARLSGVRSANLRRWAGRGVISVIHRPGHQRRYFIPELEFLARVEETWGEAPSMVALTTHIDIVLEAGFAPRST